VNEPGAAQISETANRLRISVARLARVLRRQNVDSLGATLDAALASLDREGPLSLGELAVIEQIAPPSVTRIATNYLVLDSGAPALAIDGQGRDLRPLSEAAEAALHEPIDRIHHRRLSLRPQLGDLVRSLARDDLFTCGRCARCRLRSRCGLRGRRRLRRRDCLLRRSRDRGSKQQSRDERAGEYGHAVDMTTTAVVTQ